MTKKKLLYFLIENTKISSYDITPLEEIKNRYLIHNEFFKDMDKYIDLFLKILYEDDLILKNNGYNIKISYPRVKYNKIIDGNLTGIYKKVEINSELEELEHKIFSVTSKGNFIRINLTTNQLLEYFIPNSSRKIYTTRFKKLERYRE